jgi:Family of unknown function (DUF5681)
MSEHPSDYQIGYGKPPRHARYQKGRSGNPRGRPKGAQSFARMRLVAAAENTGAICRGGSEGPSDRLTTEAGAAP